MQRPNNLTGVANGNQQHLTIENAGTDHATLVSEGLPMTILSLISCKYYIISDSNKLLNIKPYNTEVFPYGLFIMQDIDTGD